MQRELELDLRAQLEDNALLRLRCETDQLRHYAVHAWRKGRNREPAGAIRDHGPALVRCGAGGRDAHAGQQGAGLIVDDADQIGRCCPRLSGGARPARHDECEQDDRMSPPHRDTPDHWRWSSLPSGEERPPLAALCTQGAFSGPYIPGVKRFLTVGNPGEDGTCRRTPRRARRANKCHAQSCRSVLRSADPSVDIRSRCDPVTRRCR